MIVRNNIYNKISYAYSTTLSGYICEPQLKEIDSISKIHKIFFPYILIQTQKRVT
jgi:hypothetical protein